MPSILPAMKRTGAGPKPVASVPLIAGKTHERLGHLDYHRVDLSSSQPRFAGKYTLLPDIQLGKFETRAVIDWLELRLLFKRKTEFQWIQKEVKPILGRTPHVRTIIGRQNDASNVFDIRIQEPDLLAVRTMLQKLDAKFGLEMNPIVRTLEVSVDFTPKVPDEIERAKLLIALTNHLLVARDVISGVRDRPRFVISRGSSGTTSVLYYLRRLSMEQNKHFLMSTERDRAPVVDGTYELGAKEAEVRWRVMDKVIDTQNTEAGTYVKLDDASKRVRIEVTLDRQEVAALGIDFFEDLKKVNFTRLQGRYFRFFLPTFQRTDFLKADLRSAIIGWQDKRRLEKFLKTGNIGLKAMDGALAEEHDRLRRRVKTDLHQGGLKLPAKDRRGDGLSGAFFAYEDMNERVRYGLRNLGVRVADDFGVGVKMDEK